MTGRNTTVFGKFVASQGLRGVRDQIFGVGTGTFGERDDRNDLLPPAVARPSGDHHVDHRRMRRDRGLDLFGEDLLAAGIDGHRIAAQQLDGAVGAVARAIARDRVPHPSITGNVVAVLAASPL